MRYLLDSGNEEVEIVSFDGNRDLKVSLYEKGFFPGNNIRVISSSGEQYILGLDNIRFGVRKEIVEKIRVKRK